MKEEQTIQEFKTASGWAFFIYLFAPLLIGLFIFLGIMPFLADDSSWVMILFLFPVSISMVLFMMFGVASTIYGKLIIYPDKVVEIGVFKNRELEISNIKGYRSDQNYTYLIPKNPNSKKIKVSQYIGNKGLFNQWLLANFPNVEMIEAEDEVEEILANKEFGKTKEERERKLKRARIVIRFLNTVSFVLAICLFFYPKPYQLVTLVAMIFPILLIIVLHYFRGLIKIDQKNHSNYPSITYALIFPGPALAFRSLLDFEILEYTYLWFPTIALCVITTLALFSTTKEFNLRKSSDSLTAIFVLGFIFAYSYGGVVNYNCVYDESKPEVYSSEILNMRISSGKSTSYYLELKPWGPVETAKEVSVSKSLYYSLEIGETIKIYLREGKINIPWFSISGE